MRARYSKVLLFFNIFNSLSSDYHSHCLILILSHLSFSDSPSCESDGVVDDCKWVVDLMVEGLTVVGLTTSGSLLDGSWWVSVVLMSVDGSQWVWRQWVIGLLDGSRWCHGWLCCGLRLVEAMGLCHGLRLVVLVD